MRFGCLLAEAVTGTRPSWKGSRPRITRRRKPTPILPDRRRDGSPDGGGAAGAGTSGRPWVLSRVHERGDQRMRKVVTGEQVAQLSNPDPFAMPVWRAPVYRTPLGIILARQARQPALLADPPGCPLSARRHVLPVHGHLGGGWPGLARSGPRRRGVADRPPGGGSGRSCSPGGRWPARGPVAGLVLPNAAGPR